MRRIDQFHQVRGQPWDRGLHARLLNRLADDGCALVVFDSFFRQPRDPATDEALAEAMRRQQHIVLMAEQAQVTYSTLAGAQPTLPSELFLTLPEPIGVLPASTPTSTRLCAGIGRFHRRGHIRVCPGPPRGWPGRH